MMADRALTKKERDWEKRARRMFWDNQRLVRNSDMYAAEEKGRMQGLMEGYQEGYQEGLLEGRMERLMEDFMAKREEIVCNALAEGVSIKFVQKITGLDLCAINKLAIKA